MVIVYMAPCNLSTWHRVQVWHRTFVQFVHGAVYRYGTVDNGHGTVYNGVILILKEETRIGKINLKGTLNPESREKVVEQKS